MDSGSYNFINNLNSQDFLILMYSNEEVLQDLLDNKSAREIDLEFFIASWEVMIGDPHYEGVWKNVPEQLEFLKYLNKHGCNTIQDAYDKLSNRLIDARVVKYFIEEGYLGRGWSMIDRIREGYPEINFPKPI